MKKEIIFYLPEGTINDATEYYCKLLERGFINKGFSVLRKQDVRGIPKAAYILTIRAIDQRHVRFKGSKLINWFQGVVPEEFELLYMHSIPSKIFSRVLSFLERRSLRDSDLCIFVSNRMVVHFEQKYKLNLQDKSLVIPCYNIPLDTGAFNATSRYTSMNFVYAGGLFAWQCIEETLLIFKEIHRLNPEANLTLLTGDQKEATKLIARYSLVNVKVGYVKLSDLQEELKKYKYGFLIRKDSIINNVATPTKMNSYLAAGLIPIYTNVIDSFEENIDLKQYSLKIDLKEGLAEVARKVVEFNQVVIDPPKLESLYYDIFSKYYNDSAYLSKLSNVLDNGGI